MQSRGQIPTQGMTSEGVVFSFIGEFMVSSLYFFVLQSLSVIVRRVRETPYRSIYTRSPDALTEPLPLEGWLSYDDPYERLQAVR